RGGGYRERGNRPEARPGNQLRGSCSLADSGAAGLAVWVRSAPCSKQPLMHSAGQVYAARVTRFGRGGPGSVSFRLQVGRHELISLRNFILPGVAFWALSAGLFLGTIVPAI